MNKQYAFVFVMTLTIIGLLSSVNFSYAQTTNVPINPQVTPQGNTSQGISSNANQSSMVMISAGTGSAGANGPCVGAKNCFNPGTINARSGTSVTWMNNDNVIHTVTSGKSSDTQFGTLFDKNIPVGKSISIPFNNTGTVDYFCKVHPWMSGQVIVG